MINHLRVAWWIYLYFIVYAIILHVFMPRSGFPICFAVAIALLVVVATLSAVVEGILRAVVRS